MQLTAFDTFRTFLRGFLGGKFSLACLRRMLASDLAAGDAGHIIRVAAATFVERKKERKKTGF